MKQIDERIKNGIRECANEICDHLLLFVNTAEGNKRVEVYRATDVYVAEVGTQSPNGGIYDSVSDFESCPEETRTEYFITYDKETAISFVDKFTRMSWVFDR